MQESSRVESMEYNENEDENDAIGEARGKSITRIRDLNPSERGVVGEGDE